MRLLCASLMLLATLLPAHAKHHHHRTHHPIQRYDGDPLGHVVGHPAGCPGRSFCGCGTAVRIFGAPIRALWLAAAWFKFPRTSPAPGAVAVRRHHVFAIEQVLGNGRVLAYDPNSGGHQTRIHAVSLAGYTVVNPRGAGW